MSRTLLVTLGVALAACSSTRPERNGSTPKTLDVTGTIEHLGLEGGVWVIRADDATLAREGTAYEPSKPLDPALRRPHLPVRARLAVVEGVVGIHQVGPIVEVRAIAQRACGEVSCPRPPAAVTFGVVGANPLTSTTDPVVDARLTNVSAPGGAFAQGGCETVAPGADEAPTSFCWIAGADAGRYEADVIAPGYGAQHVRVEVAARQTFDYECCPIAYVPARASVELPPQACSGFAGLRCARPGMRCVDDPRDDCDPNAGGRDCLGVCVPP